MIRLQRKGKKNQPFFKIVVIEKQKSSTGGRSVEELGFYNPLTKERSLNGDRAKYWMSVGAQPSDTIYNMLVTDNVIEGKKRAKHKKSKKKEETKQAAESKVPETAADPQPEIKAEPVKEEKSEESEKTKETTEKPKEDKEPQKQPEDQPKVDKS